MLSMRSMLIGSILSLAVAGAGFAQQTQPAAAVGGEFKATVNVPVQRVVLFSSGVGFFQHEGTVEGNASTELRFQTEQINDILKSLVLTDRDGGAIRTVTYPSLDPLSKTLHSFQIDISNNPPMADILNQIRGTKVSITMPDEGVEGTILGVEKKEKPVGKDEDKVVITWMVNLITATGIRSLDLDTIKRIDILDPTLQKELQQALEALSQARDKDKKPVIVNFEGNGTRHVGIGYVIETPIWKTSYRLILPDVTSKDNAKLQGWAIVENQTDNDWKNVALDLVGGRPLSFIEALYQPLYNHRPMVTPKIIASIKPQTYDQGMGEPTGERLALESESVPAPAAMDMAEVTRGGATSGRRAKADGAFGLLNAPTAAAPATPPMKPRADYSLGVGALAQAAKIGEGFHYEVQNVSLARQRSAMIPIVTEGITHDRLSIFNPSVLPRNPLHGVRLKNNTSKYLLGGPVTVLHTEEAGTSYAGDARIDDLPAGQERLMSYAVDQEMLVDATKVKQDGRLMTGTIVKGVLHLKFKQEHVQEYTVENKAGREKTLLIEQPALPNYELVEPAKPLEKTDTLYRFQTKVPANKTGGFTVRQEWVREEVMAILPMDFGQLDFYVKNGAIPEKVKEVLRTAAAKKQAMVDLERTKAQKDQDRARVLEEQKNIRENIRVLPAGSKSQQDQITELSSRDKDLKQINGDIKELQAQIEKARADLEKYLNEMTVE